MPYNKQKQLRRHIMLELNKIGKQIKLLRKAKGLTGEKLAEILQISPQAISKWENGKCLPETMLLPELAKALNCNIDTLLIPRDDELEENDKVTNFYENVNEDVRLEKQTLEYTRSKNIISRYLFNNDMEIADVGGGSGPYSFWLAEQGHNVHLLDVTPKHIEIAKQKIKDTNIDLSSCLCADARNLPYKNESMDLVLIMGALYHLQSQDSRAKCLSEAFRVLKRGGHVICTVISRYTVLVATLKWNLSHIYDLDTLRKIIETGKVEGFTFPHAYFHTPNEIINELSTAGFYNTHAIAVEGIANAFGDYSLPADEKESTRLLKHIELIESTPELIGASRNIIAVGKKA